MSIGENVKRYREYYGMGMDEFAARMALPVEACEGIESGKRMLSSSEIQQICRILGVSLEALLSRQPSMPEAVSEDDEGSILMPVDELQNLLGKMRE